MFKRLFGSATRANRAIADAVYGQIVAAARQPVFYAEHDAPDTPLGRFEILSLHMVLFLHRLRGEQGAAAALGQDITDMFFQDVDHSLRELGIGDMGIPKRMKKLARMFYGRARAYGEALDAGDRDELAAALARNVRPDAEDWPGAPDLAGHVIAVSDRLREQPIADILRGRVGFEMGGAADR
ncbi:MAG: ubiquinol-cytochrome C chaperone family protein [Rhizobiaceae bacterium]